MPTKILRLVSCVIAALFLLPSVSWAEQDWPAIEEAAGQEGPVVVYTTLTPENWRVILDAFHQDYPDVEVTPQRTSSTAETFERYRAEAASGARTADILIATGSSEWAGLAEQGEVVAFEPSEIGNLPDFAISGAGYYAVDVDPQVLIYNKILLNEQQRPTGFADLVAKIEEFPGLFEGKIASYNPMVSPFASVTYTALYQRHGDAFWDMIDKLAPNLRFEQTAGVMIDKVQVGEYLVGFMIPRALLPQQLGEAQARVLGVAVFDDGTPVVKRDMGVMQGGGSPNGAMLLANFLLTSQGQIALGAAGLTAYYPGIENEVKFHANTLGEQAYFEYSPEVDANMEAFRARFEEATQK